MNSVGSRDVTFGQRVQDRIDAVNKLTKYKEQTTQRRPKLKEKRRIMNCHNQYSISARSASDVYDILSKAKFADAFQSLRRSSR
jgi:hypothetical protein